MNGCKGVASFGVEECFGTGIEVSRKGLGIEAGTVVPAKKNFSRLDLQKLDIEAEALKLAHEHIE